MAFIPSQALIDVEQTLTHFFDSLLPIHPNPWASLVEEKKTLSPAAAASIDKNNQALIDFYRSVIALSHKIFQFKNSKTVQYTSDIEKFKKIYSRSRDHIVASCQNLMTNAPEAWQYACHHRNGREALFYICSMLLLFTQRLEFTPFLERVLNDLKATSSDQNEMFVIDYLQFKNCNQTHFVVIQTVSQLDNPYIKAHLTLDNVPASSTIAEDTARLEQLFKSFSPISEALPSFVVSLLKIQFAYKTIFRLGGFITNQAVLNDLFIQFQRSNLGIQTTPSELSSKENILSYVCTLLESIHVYTTAYAPYFNEELTIRRPYIQLMHTFLNLFSLLEQRPVSSGMHLKLVAYATKIMLSGTVNYISSDATLELIFWERLVNLLTLSCGGYVEPGFVKMFSQYINVYVDHLAKQKMLRETASVIGAYLEYNTQLFLTDAQTVEFFTTAYYSLEILNLIAKTHEKNWALENPAEWGAQLSTLVERAQALRSSSPAFKRRLRNDFNFLPGEWKIHFLQVFEGFTRHQKAILSTLSHEHLELMKRTMSEMGLFLGVEIRVLDSIKTLLVDHTQSERFVAELLLEESSKKSTAKKAQVTPEVRVEQSKKVASLKAAVSFFEPPPKETCVEKHHLSPELIRLAERLKSELGQDLILNGSAVTYLLLKKPHPHDHDCLIFDTSHATLLDVLRKHGYDQCTVIGKDYPTLCFTLMDGTKIDLSTVSTEDMQALNFHEKMSRILGVRDFKLCALYLNLNEPGESFEIKGFSHAIRSVNQKQIAIVESRADVFEEDPIRLFRLAKINLQYPDFKIDGFLQGILNKTCQMALFKTYFTQRDRAELNQRKVSSQIEELFKRFGLIQALKKMDDIGLLKAFCGFELNDLKPHLDLLLRYINYLNAHPPIKPIKTMTVEGYKSYVTKLAFYQFLLIHVHLKRRPEIQWSDWVFKDALMRIRDSDIDSYKFINAQFNAENADFNDFPGFLYETIVEIKKREAKPEATAHLAATP